MGRRIAILMATYNGEAYVAAQIDSLLAQTNHEWTLYIHDDGSTDATPSIVARYAQEHSNIIVLDYPPQGGACANFLSLMQQVEADCYLFCDQDDVWLPEKVEKSIVRLEEEKRLHPGKPVLVYTDLQVVDSLLTLVHPSFMQYSGIHPEFLQTFDESGAAPFVTGCTMCFDSDVKHVVQFPADKAQMHDAWITLCVQRSGGVVSFIDESLILYRQHQGNTLGARDISTLTLGYRLKRFRDILRSHLQHYAMLRALGYGSFAKFEWNKWKYRQKINQLKTQ